MRKYILYFNIAICVTFVTFFSCTEYSPKPNGFLRIEKSESGYILFDSPKFSFLYPASAVVEDVKAGAKSEYWFNIIYPEYNAKIYCTYIPVGKEGATKMLDDSYQLAYNHVLKADGISQVHYEDSLRHMNGIIYDIGGTVAVPVQFYVTDNKANFLRGSLYFDDVVNSDSVAPVVRFIREDIVMIMESVKWK